MEVRHNAAGHIAVLGRMAVDQDMDSLIDQVVEVVVDHTVAVQDIAIVQDMAKAGTG